MKNKKTRLILLLPLISLSSCSIFESLNANQEMTIDSLASKRSEAKKEILEYRRNINDSLYSGSQVNELNVIYNEGNEAIDKAISAEEIDSIVLKTKNDLDSIETKEEIDEKILLNAKNEAKDELNSYKNPADYREEEKSILSKTILDAEEKIDKCLSLNEVENALNEAKDKLDKIKTNAEYLIEETPKGTYKAIITDSTRKDTINSLVATDALNRNIDEADVASSSKDVGLFYHIWHGYHIEYDAYNITNLISENPELLWSNDETLCGTYSASPINKMHYWGEPLYGYYASADPYIVGKHLELFTMSSIDYLALDLSNVLLYDEDGYGFSKGSLPTLLDKILELHNEGWDVPKILPYFGENPKTVENITKYFNSYCTSKYEPIFYKNNSKPVLAFSTYEHQVKELSSNIQNYFSFRNAIFPYKFNNSSILNRHSLKSDDMPWIDWIYPQAISSSGYMSVSVAQHPSYAMSYSVNQKQNYDYNSNFGRGYDFNKKQNNKDNVRKGSNLEAQWATALNNIDSVNEVMVTGWNEWIATKLTNYYNYPGLVSFADTVNEEFSRDLEMSKGMYGDNFYLQNMSNVRKFKSNNTTSKKISNKSSKELNDMTFWNDGRTYVDFVGDAIPRDGKINTNFMNVYPNGSAVKKINYTNNTNRNDISNIQVTNDEEFLYFRVNTVNDIDILDKNKSFIALFDVKNITSNRWNNYNFVLDITNATNKTKLYKFAEENTFTFSKVCDANSFINKNVFISKIPLKSLGITNPNDFVIDFKVADSISDPSDIMNYYIDGDSAPIGRLNYRYNSGK